MKFAVICPHCQVGNEDPLDMMTRNDLDSTHCESCGKKFHYLIADCASCEEESVFEWQEAPDPPPASRLDCSRCGLRLEFSDGTYFADQSRVG
jgi:ribosomal protein L37E